MNKGKPFSEEEKGAKAPRNEGKRKEPTESCRFLKVGIAMAYILIFLGRLSRKAP